MNTTPVSFMGNGVYELYSLDILLRLDYPRFENLRSTIEMFQNF
jgi:hypothetical protein